MENMKKAELLDLVFFFVKMTHAEVRLETNGFMLSYPEYHTHVDLDWFRLEDVRNIIIALHEYNLKHIEQETYESLKEKGIDSISFISSRIKEGYIGKSLVQKSDLDEYLKVINSIKEKLEG